MIPQGAIHTKRSPGPIGAAVSHSSKLVTTRVSGAQMDARTVHILGELEHAS